MKMCCKFTNESVSHRILKISGKVIVACFLLTHSVHANLDNADYLATFLSFF